MACYVGNELQERLVQPVRGVVTLVHGHGAFYLHEGILGARRGSCQVTSSLDDVPSNDEPAQCYGWIGIVVRH